MRKSRRFFTYIVFLLCVLIVAASCSDVAYAKEMAKNQATEYLAGLEDAADLYSVSEETTLLNRMQEITQYCNVALVTISENDEKTTQGFAEKKCYDMFGEESSVLFLIDMEYREISIYAADTAYDKVTNNMANIITDNVYLYASGGEYFKCADVAFSQIFDLLGGRPVPQPMKYISNFFIAAILAVLFNYVLVLFTSRRVVSPKSKLKNGVEAKFEVVNVLEEVESSEEAEEKTAFEKLVELADKEEKMREPVENRANYEDKRGITRGTFLEPNQNTYSELEALFEDEDSIFGENGLFGEFLSGEFDDYQGDYNYRRSSSSGRRSSYSSSRSSGRNSSRSSYSGSRSSGRSTGRSSGGSSRSSGGRGGGGGHRF